MGIPESDLLLVSIDSARLCAPPGQHDDRAMACVLALVAASKAELGESVIIPPRPMWPGDTDGGNPDWLPVW